MQNFFEAFRESLRAGGLDGLRAGLIGRDAQIDGPFGPVRLLYADWVASGRALAQVEDAVRDFVLPFYANSHTEASHCGMVTTRLREAARAVALAHIGGGPDCHAIFAGSGATAGISRLVSLLDLPARVRAGARVVVLHGPYEHHSNLLPWRESGAEVREVAEAPGGGVDMVALDSCLDAAQGAETIVGAFSACSNVTGILTDVEAVTRRLKARGALAVWDYAGGGPYLPIRMVPAPGVEIDAVALSPHKFPGGPGASGLLIVRDTVVRAARPSVPGGGTVSFVSPWAHDYSSRVEAREEGGTPNVLGDIRAALALCVKEAAGVEAIGARDAALRARALAELSDVPGLELLGREAVAPALPILSFRLRDEAGRPVHHQLVTRLLSDLHGVQARGGCACAGPYAHRLLGIDEAASEVLRARLARGEELDKPGWTRLNLSWLHSDGEVTRILAAVRDVAQRIDSLAGLYAADPATARFTPLEAAE
ncbi:MAG: aminotransferase class V-fold PLP-dependent enzyme [Paracoccaceae bacterium]|jgi:selenocysteine lyase/cysteine desulfurase|nr:aminotransferase class V-fold PLP-dependent enzyme [Paracoccaceae bacterium]